MENDSILILRFRDLTVSEGLTVTEHNKLINESESAWWGWWAKPDEKLALENFLQINRMGGIKTYLLDSGNGKLYYTNCTEIKFCSSGSKIVSPAENLTPDYYSTSEFYAWYRFNTEIQEVENPKEILSSYAYYLTDSSLHKSSLIEMYRVLDNKVIEDIEELIHQNRTIWFARPKKREDREGKYLFSESLSSNTKELVDQEPQFIRNNKLLWLSDIHFSSRGKHEFISSAADKNDLKTVLTEVLNEKSEINKIGGMIISGDLAYVASEEEFDYSFLFLNEMNNKLNLQKQQTLVIPGNHDLSFHDGESNEMIELTENSKKEYVKFCEKYFQEIPNKHLYSIRRFITKDFVPLEIIGINSLALQQYQGRFQGMGYIGDEQIRAISADIDSFQELYGTPNRIIVIHQHIMPVAVELPESNRMYSSILDSEGMIAKLVYKYNVKAVLHGHTHKDFYCEQSRLFEDRKINFSVIGIGSAGVAKCERGEEPNVFGILEIEKSYIDINIYTIFSAKDKTSEKKATYRIEF